VQSFHASGSATDLGLGRSDEQHHHSCYYGLDGCLWSGIECLSDAFGWGKRMKAGMAGRVFATLTTELRVRLVRQVKKSLRQQVGGGNTKHCFG
jgi:hypothetical protein